MFKIPTRPLVSDKGPFKYYIIKEVGGWGQKKVKFLMIYTTVNHQKLPFSDPTHPPL